MRHSQKKHMSEKEMMTYVDIMIDKHMSITKLSKYCVCNYNSLRQFINNNLEQIDKEKYDKLREIIKENRKNGAKRMHIAKKAPITICNDEMQLFVEHCSTHPKYKGMLNLKTALGIELDLAEKKYTELRKQYIKSEVYF